MTSIIFVAFLVIKQIAGFSDDNLIETCKFFFRIWTDEQANV